MSSDDANWTFAVAAPADVRRLAAAAGFWFDWDEARQQFDHPAMLAGIRDGRLVRLLVGGMVSSGRLDELVREVSGEFVAELPAARPRAVPLCPVRPGDRTCHARLGVCAAAGSDGRDGRDDAADVLATRSQKAEV